MQSRYTFDVLSSRPCSIACQDECAFSGWSSWTRCNSGCTGMRERSRQLIRDSKIANCSGRLKRRKLSSIFSEQVSRQSEPCSLDRNCAIIKVTWEPWSTCQFLSTSDQCGSGFQIQAANCYVGANFTIHSDCKISKPTRIRTCSVDCDQDCVASEWTPWR